MNPLPHYKNEWFNFVDYTPHDGQLQLHTAPENVRFIVACCGRRFGKSYSAAREAELVLSQPNKMIWIVSPNYNTSEKIFRIVYDDMVAKKATGHLHLAERNKYYLLIGDQLYAVNQPNILLR